MKDIPLTDTITTPCVGGQILISRGQLDGVVSEKEVDAVFVEQEVRGSSLPELTSEYAELGNERQRDHQGKIARGVAWTR
jgi:hypothetical protein